ncbi:nonribosomal peptide synthetase MxaA [Xanthobacter sp. AM11]|uniref:nonribosomal peptide synthetase MxaA n=1 Tax=Xanthobacter sp. AM11 TaxID=3380643 RepID=UPI0039BF35C9
MARRAAFLLLCAVLSAATAARAATVELFAPRAFGYLIGDTIEHEAVITLDPGFVLDAASLPRVRPVTYWLDLTRVRLEPRPAVDGGLSYGLKLTYQTFYAPLEPRALTVPAIALVARKDAERLALSVPEWTFVSSPLREIAASRAANPMALQPDLPPPPFAVGADAGLAALWGGLAGLCLLGLALLRGWGPFARRRLPFVVAARRIVRLAAAAQGGAADAYSAALLELHRAFDAAAGRRLLADDVPAFLAARPDLAREGEGVARFFAASRIAFFGDGAAAACAAFAPADLAALARGLAAAERGAVMPRRTPAAGTVAGSAAP